MTRGLSVNQLIAALQRKSVPLPFETAAFMVLEASERVSAEPVLVSAADLRLTDEGELVLPARTARAEPSDREACRALCTLLGELLVGSAQSVPPMLLRLVEPGASEGPGTPAELRDELEALLVPLNRAAMRRVVARLVREAKREQEDGRPKLSLHPHPIDQEHELDAILGGPPAPSRRDAPAVVADATPEWDRSEPEDDSAELDAVLAGLDRKPLRVKPSLPAAGRPEPSAPASSAPARRAESLRPRPTLALGDQHDTLDRFEHLESGARPMGARIGWAALLFALLLVGGALLLGRDRTRGLVGLDDPPAQGPAPAPVRAVGRQYGVLHVTSTPPRAQVLLRIGKAPATAAKLPVGMVHEFVAVRAGFAPARALVAADAQWRPQAGELRYELALQLREASAKEETQVGAARMVPSAQGTPTGALGSVRVITSPPDAEVFQLIGFTPEVKVENLPTDEPIELLIARPDYETQRVSLGPSDWKPQASGTSADVDVTLPKRSAGGSRERK